MISVISKIALVLSLIALAACFLVVANGILGDGIKGLRQKAKPAITAFIAYVACFLIFLFTQ